MTEEILARLVVYRDGRLEIVNHLGVMDMPRFLRLLADAVEVGKVDPRQIEEAERVDRG